MTRTRLDRDLYVERGTPRVDRSKAANTRVPIFSSVLRPAVVKEQQKPGLANELDRENPSSIREGERDSAGWADGFARLSRREMFVDRPVELHGSIKSSSALNLS